MGLKLTENKYPDCPYYKPPRMASYKDKIYEASAMCDIHDKFCVTQYGLSECEEYNLFLKEEGYE